jgi:hypothetical protein
MKTKLLAGLLLAGSAAFAGGNVSIGVSIGGGPGYGYAPAYAYMPPPPPPRAYYSRPRMPGPGFVWVDGFWAPHGKKYKWTNGYWVRHPRRGADWVAPRYSNIRYYGGDLR